MSPILPKDQMTEEDIKLNYITPAIQSRGWKDRITMETAVYFTDGRINIQGNIAVRGPRKKADYILYFSADNPIAIVEAKDNNHTVMAGLQQAKEYAEMLDIPFAYSSNGDGFEEFDFLTGQEREIPLDEFPTYDELSARYKAEANHGCGLNPMELAVMNQPYYSDQNINTPRYYQRKAVNRSLDAIARGEKRLLLVMATGTGKTRTAFQIVYRLLQARLVNKVLYLADRNNLVDQSIEGDFSPLGNVIHKINYAADTPNTISAYQVYFSLYQQLTDMEYDERDEEETVMRLKSLFRPDFFDLVIIDECHRGSAKKDSSWRKILEYFESAVQIGMTATPKETDKVSNIDYFGEPVYVYKLKEGIDDGFLAPFRVVGIKTNISDGWRPYKGQTDIYGNEIEDRIYQNSDYDYNIILEDRIYEVANQITNYLKSTDRMAKTIVFCATELHADLMRKALVNANSDMVAQNPDYVVRITGSDPYGQSKLKYFESVNAQYPVIATTSKLLTTGADTKMVKIIAIDQWITSVGEFKQIIGRGTRIREKDGKTHFTVMDFRGVSRLFADPDWDGEIEQDENFNPNAAMPDKPDQPGKPPVDPDPPAQKAFVDANGCKVEVVQKTVSIYDTDGKLLRQESIIDYTKSNIVGEYASLDAFIQTWTAEEKKQKIQQLFRERGIDLDALKAEQGMADVDDFDFICHVAFDRKPLTRKERANNVKKRDFLSKYGDQAREVLEALLDQYMNVGIYELESMDVLKLDPLKRFGAPAKIVKLFGGKDGYLKAVRELEEKLYEVA